MGRVLSMYIINRRRYLYQTPNHRCNPDFGVEMIDTLLVCVRLTLISATEELLHGRGCKLIDFSTYNSDRIETSRNHPLRIIFLRFFLKFVLAFFHSFRTNQNHVSSVSLQLGVRKSRWIWGKE